VSTPDIDNRILDLKLENRSLDPVAAEVTVIVRLERLTATTALRGKLMGPSCPYAATVEIAYPLLPQRRNEPQEEGSLRSRVVIPEASLWDPQSPFLYGGPIELWEDGQCVDRVTVRHGLRRLSISPQGLRVNGKRFLLAGRAVTALDEEQALTLRQEGCNLLLVELGDSALSVWDLADRLGFLVLGRTDLRDEHREELARLSRRPSCLGWLLPPDPLARVTVPALLAVESSAISPGAAALVAQREGNRFLLRADGGELGHIEDAQALT
jgi:beta-galactosidase/beta-glucuronidase